MVWDVTRARIRQAIGATMALAQAEADEAQEFMRDTARWTDRTEAARTSLTARVYMEGQRTDHPRARIDLFYDERVLEDLNPEEYARVGDYGRFLEGEHGGEYAIVQPTAIRLRERLGRGVGRIWIGL
jgi:hypothetical protein